MKISKKTREEAILICEAHASNGWPPGANYRRGYYWVACELGLEQGDACTLAVDAWRYVRGRESKAWWDEGSDANAAALLREGWSP